MEIVSVVTVVRVIVDSKISFTTVSVDDVAVVLVEDETVIVVISSMVSVINTSHEAVNSIFPLALNQPQHFLKTETAIERRLIARMSSPTTFSRKNNNSDSKSYSSYSVHTQMRMLLASSCR